MEGTDRRRFLKAGATTAAAYGLLGAVAPFERLAAAATPTALPEIQYDIGAFLGDVARWATRPALDRSSRTERGTPLHIRLDGPGYDALDLPRGTGPRPKLQFSVFVPTSEQFRTMRRQGSSPDLAEKHAIPLRSNGLERFTTTTRRQNVLVPPRAHRAFPLAELV